ncbi:MAG TPA: glutamine--fructose-6-phosphate transaminase (isomerizing), partial [Thermomicrobiales bacterium]|nr:glutamine--fructose-6-phosphate transaminase (isomerizing) [Thermomicrobiales bacterium]
TGRINGASVSLPPSDLGFGHTRWATHGGVTEGNAHPHLDCAGRLAVVHNGIVENHRALRDELLARGHRFRSETDSEVIAHLLEERVGAGADLATAVREAFARLDGLNAIVAMDVVSRELVATKNVSPLVAGLGRHGTVIASDAIALMPHTARVLYLEDGQLLRANRDGVALYDRATLAPADARFAPIDWDAASAELGAYSHFMTKEMAEQPAVIERLARDGRSQIEALAARMRTSTHVVLTGCGTAANAALAGQYLIGRIARRAVTMIPASEFRYHATPLGPDTLVVAFSQSGETVDLIEAALAAKRSGATLAAVVNCPRSTLDRMADLHVHLGAGPEQCVLATKSYTAKVAALILIASALHGEYARGADIVNGAAKALGNMLAVDAVNIVKGIARRIDAAEHMFVIGRGAAYPTALEAALKIKEASYIHAEGFAGGELKHGVIALVADGTPCLVFVPHDETRADILSGAAELKSRGGFLIGVGPEPDPVFDAFIATPDAGDGAPIVNALPAQMLAYHAALLRGADPDRPRNLAKSVTVK